MSAVPVVGRVGAPSVVITGLGVAVPTGLGAEAHWDATLAGRSGIDRITRFDPSPYPVRLAGEVRDFDAADHMPRAVVKQTDHTTHLAFAAVGRALADAGIDPAEVPEFERSVVAANSSGGAEFGQRELQKLYSRGPRAVGAFMSIAWFYAATTGQLSIRHGMRGPCGVLSAEQAGGLDALGQARRLVGRGSRVVVAGGSDAPISPYGMAALVASRMLSTRQNPCRAYLPFDAEACGYLPGDGGAYLVLEDAESARARGARPYGRLTGYAATTDPPPGSGRAPTLCRAARLALADAGVTPADVDVVFADGHGVPELDDREAAAIVELFGPFGVPVTVPKTLTGRLYAGGSALDVVTALQAIRHAVIPATAHVRADPRHRLDLVCGAPRETRIRNALVLARGHRGLNAAVVVSALP